MSISSVPHRTIQFWLFAAMILVFPFSLKVSNAIIILCGVHWLWWCMTDFACFRFKNKLLGLQLLPFVLSAVSLLYTEHIGRGVYVLDKKFTLFLFPLIMATSPSMGIARKNRLLYTFVLAFSIMGIFCLAHATFRLWSGRPGGFFWYELTSPVGDFHPTYCSIILNFLIVFLGTMLNKNFETWNPTKKIGTTLIIIFFYALIILLSSKIQIIFSLCILFYLTFLFRAWFRTEIVYPAIVVLGLLGAWFLKDTYTFKRFTNISSLHYELDAPVSSFNELTIRFAIAECAWDLLKDNFWIGIGAGDIEPELDRVYRKYDYKFGYLDQHNPHNEYLSQFLAVGFLGLCIFIASLFVPLLAAFNRKDNVYCVFLLLCITSFVLESFLERQKGIVFFGFVNALLLFHGLDRGLATRDPSNNLPSLSKQQTF